MFFPSFVGMMKKKKEDNGADGSRSAE